MKDRKVYDAKVKEIKTICNEHVLKLKAEHEAKLDILENDYETNLKILQEFESPEKSSRCHQFQQTIPVPCNDQVTQTQPSPVTDLSVQTDVKNFSSVGSQTDPIDIESVDDLQAKVDQLKKKMAELV